MAERPVFIPVKFSTNRCLVNIKIIEFRWKKGMSKINKQICIDNFHKSIKEKLNINNILEISSSSKSTLGIQLSAFNLSLNPYKIDKKFPNKNYFVESLFQGSKVFSFKQGPYQDLYKKTSIYAKKDPRVKNKNIKNFLFFNEKWPNYPYTLFYDYIYMNALLQNQDLVKQVVKYDIFTDIHFNLKKSLNSQAYAAALFVSLYRNNFLSYIKNKNRFIEFSKKINYTSNSMCEKLSQQSLF